MRGKNEKERASMSARPTEIPPTSKLRFRMKEYSIFFQEAYGDNLYSKYGTTIWIRWLLEEPFSLFLISLVVSWGMADGGWFQ